MTAATTPVAAPVPSIVRRRCFSVAPTADIIPSCGSRRCAMTVKLAAAMSATSIRTSVLTTRVSTAATTFSGRSPREAMMRPVSPGGRNWPTRASLAFDEHRHELRLSESGRREENELVAEIARVLDHADHDTLHAVEVDRRTDAHAERVDDSVGHRDLVAGGGIATRAQAQHRLPERAIGILGSVVDLLHRARQRHGSMPDRHRSRRTTSSPASSFGCNVAGVVVVEPEEVVGVAELSIVRRPARC